MCILSLAAPSCISIISSIIMPDSVFLRLALILLCFEAYSLAQSCGNSTDPKIDLALQQFPLCTRYVSPSQQTFIPIFGFPVQYVQGMNGLVRLLGTNLRVGKNRLSAPRSCVDNALRYFCSFLFRPCSPEGLPRSVCQDTCVGLDSICRIYITGILAARNASSFGTLLLPPCDALESGNPLEGSTPEIAGQPVFPNANGSGVVWNLTAGEVSVQCNDAALISPLPDYPCYYPWHLEAQRNDTPYCRLSCPVPTVRASLYKYNARLMLCIGIIDIILSATTFILRSAVPQYRAYPSNLILWILGCGVIYSIQLVWPFMRAGGHHNFICVDSLPSYRLDIRLQGGIMEIFNLAMSNYWAAIAVHTIVAVHFGAHYLNLKTQIITHCYGLGFPIVLTVIALATKQLAGYDHTNPFGYYKTVKPGHYYPIGEWIFYWGPSGFDILVAVPCVLYVLVTSLKRQADGNNFHWQRNFRIILFLSVFLFNETWKWSFRIWVLSWQKQFVNDIFNYVACTAIQPGCPRGRDIGIQSPIFLAFVFIPPTLLAILFGSNEEIRGHWFASYRNRTNPWTTSTTASTGTPKAETYVLTASITDS